MQILVASDNSEASRKIWDVLLRDGHSSQTAHVVDFAEAANRVAQLRPKAILLVLSPDPERAFALLDEFRVMTHAPVLGIGPSSDAKLILRTMREGAHQYLDEDELHGELSLALKRLAANDTTQEEPGRVITVLAPSGGSGSSTLAVNIAMVLSKQHERCALFDLKLETGDLATLLDLSPEHTMADFCANISRMDRSMFEQCFVVHSSGVHLLAAPEGFNDVSRVTAPGIRRALSMARLLFPYVVVDLDHCYRSEHAQAVHHSDVVLLIARQDILSLRQTRRALEYLDHLQVDSDRIRLVINRYRWRGDLRVKQLERALGRKVLHYVPDDPKSLKRANNKGVPVTLGQPESRVARSIFDIATSVNGHHSTDQHKTQE